MRRANMNAQHQVNQQVGSGSQPVFSTDSTIRAFKSPLTNAHTHVLTPHHEYGRASGRFRASVCERCCVSSHWPVLTLSPPPASSPGDPARVPQDDGGPPRLGLRQGAPGRGGLQPQDPEPREAERAQTPGETPVEEQRRLSSPDGTLYFIFIVELKMLRRSGSRDNRRAQKSDRFLSSTTNWTSPTLAGPALPDVSRSLLHSRTCD